VPPAVLELTPCPDPVQCCEQLTGLPYRLFLDSAAGGSRLGRYSFLTADPVSVVRSKGRRTEILAGDRCTPFQGDALDAVRFLLTNHTSQAVDGLPPFQGGAAGYLAYDWGLVLEPVRAPRYDDLAIPDVVLGIYDWVIAWDHLASRAWLISTGLPERDAPARDRRARARADAVTLRLMPNPATDRLKGSDPGSDPGRRNTAEAYRVEGGWWGDALELRSSFTRDAYLAAVQRVRDYIFAGDIFQANLSQRFETPFAEDPWTLYRRLRIRNAAPFAAFVDFPEAMILSASPERFLQADVGGRVETRPIKGTSPRGLGPEHDGALGVALTESAKDRAENLMIVDLMRNDLSRVCAPGSVRVPELFALERYATVHHLVSTVVGQLADGADALDLIRATFPGGSITGAPKVRAMDVIAELEPSQRGVYCGSVGYWSVTGALDTSIAIRTALARHGRLYFSAGGGIVADSQPEQEYRETLDKARGIIDVLAIG
jgi:para-aminobenzoate synthetase component 1